MRRQQHKDTTTALQLHSSSSSSSIALLQERFRQLQRVKEMREEKELQKVSLALSPSPSPEPHSTTTRPLWICHPDLVRPVSAHPAASSASSISTSSAPAAVGAVRYLGINAVNFLAEGSTATGGSSISRCSGSSSAIQNLKKTCSGDTHDVDTSLHL